MRSWKRFGTNSTIHTFTLIIGCQPVESLVVNLKDGATLHTLTLIFKHFLELDTE